jgi:CDP-diacylglycerol--serine O-phosphatidyltransferase
MKKGIYILPNTLTLCSMFFGFYSIISAVNGNYVHSAWAIMISTIFDGLDGWVARLTHSTIAFLFVACGALRLARYNVQMGSTESKAFTGMPSPAAAGIMATLVIFYYEIWDGTPEKNYFILLFTIFIALLMVSTLKFHGFKEIDFSKRKPFWILVAFVLLFGIIIIHPPIALFILAIFYLSESIIENIYLFYRRQKLQNVKVKI